MTKVLSIFTSASGHRTRFSAVSHLHYEPFVLSLSLSKIAALAVIAVLPGVVHAQWTGTNPITTGSKVGIGTTIANTTARLNIQSGFDIEDAGIGCQIYNNTGPALRIHWATNNPGVYGCPTVLSGAPNIIDVTGNFYTATTQTTPTVQSLLTMNTLGQVALGGTPVGSYKLSVAGHSQFSGYIQMQNRVRITNSATLTAADFVSVPYSFSVDNGDARFMGKLQLGSGTGNIVLEQSGAARFMGAVQLGGGTGAVMMEQNGNARFDGAVTVGQTINVTGDGEFRGTNKMGFLHLGYDFNNPAATPFPLNNGWYHLIVWGDALMKRAKVAVPGTTAWSDYVFADDYKLRPLEEVEKFIEENKHLPDVPSAEEVVREGLDLGAMDATLLRKVEELTLYVLKQQKEIDELKKELRGQTEVHSNK